MSVIIHAFTLDLAEEDVDAVNRAVQSIVPSAVVTPDGDVFCAVKDFEAVNNIDWWALFETQGLISP